MKYALDTNLYIRAIRDAAFAAELAAFFRSHSPRTFLSSIVFHEIVIGAGSKAKRLEIETRIGRPFHRTGRVFAPSHHAWAQGAETLAALSLQYGLDRARLPRSFVNDVLLTTSCRESGVTLITDNPRDFERIRSRVQFEFEPPWPSPA